MSSIKIAIENIKNDEGFWQVEPALMEYFPEVLSWSKDEAIKVLQKGDRKKEKHSTKKNNKKK